MSLRVGDAGDCYLEALDWSQAWDRAAEMLKCGRQLESTALSNYLQFWLVHV